ncbi:MAG: type I-B CRISPR-associated protein Cas5 [Melioribacteraceae bacterium]|nr:type I-B CRISPR-associated protein Cas5 [Melioribacteraceae bacterium]
MNTKLISIDLKSQFGFLKKIDTNAGIYFTYNIIHRPALLGILGAICGLKGMYQAYPNGVPEYWEKLENIKLSIVPLNSQKGLYNKTIVQYNNSVGYASQEQGGNLIIKEQILIKPSYRIYLKLDVENNVERNLYLNLKNGHAVYIPYLGKNDFQLWWDNFSEIENFVQDYKPTSKFRIDSIFYKEKSERINNRQPQGLGMEIDLESALSPEVFAYFEQLPFEFNDVTGNYNLKSFSYTNMMLPQSFKAEKLCKIENGDTIIQLF